MITDATNKNLTNNQNSKNKLFLYFLKYESVFITACLLVLFLFVLLIFCLGLHLILRNLHCRNPSFPS